MDLTSVNAVTSQATLNLNTQNQKSVSSTETSSLLATEDNVEISEKGYALASQAGESEETSKQSGTATTGASGSTSSSTSEETIEELEEQIKELEKEIAELAAKARNDEKAQIELNAKQAQLSALYSQLVELQQNQEQG